MAQYTDQSSICNDTNNGEHQFNGANRQPSSQFPIITIDVHKGKPIRLQVKVVVPIHDHPNYNFVGKLLGPKGNSLKWLQEQTQTKMAILGKGSMRNKEKEEELRSQKDPKYFHLNEDLHVEITAFAPAPEAYRRISSALYEIKRFLVPDYYDDIRQQQLRELGVITEKDDNYKIISQSECVQPPINTSNDVSTIMPYQDNTLTSMKFITQNDMTEMRHSVGGHPFGNEYSDLHKRNL